MRSIFSQVVTRKLLIPIHFTLVLVLLAQVAYAQEATSNQNANRNTVGTAATAEAINRNVAVAPNAPAASPVFTDYKGIRIGMSADVVRNKLDHLKEKDKAQDFFVFSEAESAQVFYDAEGKVEAISIIYMGDDGSAPKSRSVLGEEIQAKPDGSMYELKRYPEAGYWVAYSRTAGKNPVVTVT